MARAGIFDGGSVYEMLIDHLSGNPTHGEFGKFYFDGPRDLSRVLPFSGGFYLFGFGEKIIGFVGEAGGLQFQFLGTLPKPLRVVFRCGQPLQPGLPRCEFLLCHTNKLPRVGFQDSPFDSRWAR